MLTSRVGNTRIYIVFMQCVSPLQFAAHKLDKDAKQWEDNEMVAAARRMAQLMRKMAKFAR